MTSILQKLNHNQYMTHFSTHLFKNVKKKVHKKIHWKFTITFIYMSAIHIYIWLFWQQKENKELEPLAFFYIEI